MTVHNCTHNETKYQIVRVDANGSLTVFPYPSGFEIAMTGEGNAYLVDANGVAVARDVTNWTTKWTTTAVGTPILGVDGGGAVLDTGTVVGSDGAVSTPLSLNLQTSSSVAKLGYWIGTYWEGNEIGNVVRAFRGADVIPAAKSFTYATYVFSGPKAGNPWNQGQTYLSCEAGKPIALDADFDSWQPGLVEYRFDGEDWTEERVAAVKAAFTMWNEANSKAGVNVQFTDQPIEDAPLLRLFTIHTASVDGVSALGFFQPDTDGIENRWLRNARIVLSYSDLTGGLATSDQLRMAALHEIGHSLAIDHNDHTDPSGLRIHPFGFNGSSIMNSPALSGTDPAGYMPRVIMPCDRQRARDAANRHP